MGIVNGDISNYEIYSGNPKDYIGYSCIIKQAMIQPERECKEIKKFKEGIYCKIERYTCGCKVFHGKFKGDKFIPKKCRKQTIWRNWLDLDFNLLLYCCKLVD